MKGCKKRGKNERRVQDRIVAEHERCCKGEIQDWRDAGKEGRRKEGMNEIRDPGMGGCRKGGMQERINQERRDAEHERCWKRGIQEWRDGCRKRGKKERRDERN